MRKLFVTAALASIAVHASAQETRFTREMPTGSSLILTNINGAVTLTASTSRTLEVVATKKVTRGKGDQVSAIIEEKGGTVRVCTLDKQSSPDRTTCTGTSGKSSVKGEHDQVEMTYVVRVPAGVIVTANTVNGNVAATGLGRIDELATVNGNISVKGGSAGDLSTVNGDVAVDISGINWDGALKLESVNGSVAVRIPPGFLGRFQGETVSGAIQSDFPQLKVTGQYGPKSLRGVMGTGEARTVNLSTVNGKVSVLKQ